MFEPTTIVSFAILLGVLILVHEWGHFAIAKLFGVRVEVFSIGFGKRIWGWKRGDTDYRLSILPLGGYVKMAGDNPMEERAGAPDEFMSKPRWQRAIIALAGPAMNIVLALVLLTGMVYVVGLGYPAYLDSPVEVVAFPKGSLAERAGVRIGDRVVGIDSVRNPSWRQARQEVAAATDAPVIQLVVEREGAEIPITIPVEGPLTAERMLGYEPLRAILDVVVPGSPADKAGLQPGDEITAIDGNRIAVWSQFVETVRGSEGRALKLAVRRGNLRIPLEVTPVLNRVEDGEAWQIGVQPRADLAYEEVSFAEAVSHSVSVNVFYSRQILVVVGQLLRGRLSLKQLGGPVEIARQSRQAAKRGIQDFLSLMVLISLNLAILNLLPIPILDGGHILLLSIEGLLRRDLSLAVKERFVQVGMVFLLVIFAIVMYNDVLKSFR